MTTQKDSTWDRMISSPSCVSFVSKNHNKLRKALKREPLKVPKRWEDEIYNKMDQRLMTHANGFMTITCICGKLFKKQHDQRIHQARMKCLERGVRCNAQVLYLMRHCGLTLGQAPPEPSLSMYQSLPNLADKFHSRRLSGLQLDSGYRLTRMFLTLSKQQPREKSTADS